ncbi:LuxR family transcriptional regulator [Solimonas sp. K1W22B-7]|uniref:LuxR C-terminal-related transcriptional regulator n=1 Tax=Solimonas sp. K1W22B-7 TaxID=2303331 RepID=UPI000E330622|nr:LuxR C-terminal-related transcriptional regulator [Solimonas sp. K1W22B-7]AXQ27895.1 LuxR family transcriptional regulator [Solimonas sp. K1W22B-7]
MDAVTPPAEVFTHKFFAPPSYPGAIHRQELLGRLFRQPGYGVVVVQAPAGHGKSTLLQQAKTLAEQQGALTGWLSFDEADNDMRRFTVHMQALVDGLGSQDAATAAPPGTRRRLSDLLATQLVQLDRPVRLFFDEFQMLNNRGVLTAFRDLLERIPENVTLFIGSRALPEIGLARLMVNNQALVLRADDLRFTHVEAQQFFSQARDLGINPQELDAIYRQTEGWPAALQLFRLSLASPAVRRALTGLSGYKPRELAEYLADNVLTLQTPRVQEFLRRSSVLTRLSAGLCDHITGWQDSQSILLFLERSGLFLRSLDSDLCWFKYHTLFSSFLAEQVRSEEPEALLEVHQRAADWFHAHGMHEDALHHAIAARNYGFATDIMNVWADRLIADANLVTMERWSDNLPLDEIARRPDLAIKIAWALIFLRRHHKLRPILTTLADLPGAGPDTDVVRSMLALVLDDMPQAFELVDRMDIQGQQPVGFRAFELGAAANVKGYRALCAGDFDSAREHLNLARSYGERGAAAFSGGYTVAVTGMNLVMQGRLGEALARYRSGLAEHHLDLEKPFATASLVSCYISALYENNDLDTAESMFTQFHDVICDGVLLDFMVPGYIAMARIHDARGRSNRTEEILAEAEQIAHTAGWPRLMRIISWERVRRLLLDGEIDRAQVIASRIPRQPEFALPEGWMIYTEATEGDAIGAIRVALHSGQTDVALTQLAAELGVAQRQGRSYRQIKLLVLDALAQRAHGNDNHAHRSLHRALQLAAPGGFVRLFLDEGEKILPLLRDEHTALAGDGNPENGSLRAFVTRLLEAAGHHAEVNARPHADVGFQPLEPLTDRERQILVYLANGVSNKEMARRIFVSENTVKFHLKNIYSKLAVASRLQAINAARQMGLL